ncbi:MAG: sterol desaturase family protein [Myxococcota bacterium]
MADPIALAIPLFFLAIGVELAVARWQGRRVYRFADAITDLSCGIGQQVTGLFVGAWVVLPYVWIASHAPIRLSASSPWTHLLTFLGVDLAYYAWHRWTHESSLGWATHVVHHQSEDYNLAVALRQSMTSSLSGWPFYLPLAALGVPVEVFALHTALNTLYQFWIHTETVRTVGPLEWVLNTPAHHRVHHAINPAYLDKNYAGVLIVWDRLFGTFTPETETAVYGTVTPLRSFDPLWANVAFVVDRARATRAARSVGEVARAWLGPPSASGDPAGPGPTSPKYDPRGPRGAPVYVLAWFVPVAAATTGMLWVSHTAPPAWLALGMVLVLWTTWTWSGLFERAWWVAPAEGLRLAAVAVAGTVATRELAWAGPAVWAACAASAVAFTWLWRQSTPE